ncbi:hypothetical protein ACHHYP_09249 [Achlya hypogyna]|uniref:Transmembrane protein n=1 Tax=Achlya hypogyna TaxID=1202772 RepID=A0A1V9ZJE6_ACHHY|nr:hypothetical protein ACHHYP_09249 [Achlya hypogyna]
MATNGAVFFESGLRNIRDWNGWDGCWGDSFNVGFALTLKTSSAGAQWLAAVRTNLNSVLAEASYWRAVGIQSFNLQWQNYKTTAFSDQVLVENALGLQFPLPLARVAGAFHPTHQNSMVMYWGLASDLWAIDTNTTSIVGSCLLRASPRFAYTNITSQQLLAENLTLPLPLSTGYAALESSLGPFNAIDMTFVPCPPPLVTLYSALSSTLATLTATNLSVQETYLRLPSKFLVIDVPPTWLSLPMELFAMGGNIFCPSNMVGGPFFMGYGVGFAETNTCNTFITDNIEPSIVQLLFALLGFNATMHLHDDDWTGICGANTYMGANCSAEYSAAVTFLDAHTTALAPAVALAPSVRTAVQDLDVRILQYVCNMTDMDVNLFTLGLLDASDRPWNFYGWLILFEWVAGRREVLNFAGDSGSLVTITQGVSPVTLTPDTRVLSATYAPFFQAILRYISGVLIGIAGIIVAYTVHMRGLVEGLNLFELNRVVGMVWIGRSFLVVRSITAICLLNTTTLHLVRIGVGTQFESPALPWYKSFLASAEATWLVYVLNDLFSCVTHQYTPYYAFKSSLLAWVSLVRVR